jgi:hypothetical protein
MGTAFEKPIEYVVHRTQHEGITAEIRRQCVNHPLIGLNLLDDPIERFDIGTSKGVDRLFRITHDEEFSWFERYLLPIRRMTTYLLGHGKNNLVLHRVGILKLVHKDSPILLFDPLPNGGVLVEQRARAGEKPVKGKPSLLEK